MSHPLRTLRLFILLLAGIAAIFLNNVVIGFPVLFAIALIISAGLTMVDIFMQFDKPFNGKLLMEFVADGFTGLVLFTYPLSDERFFLIVFSFWIVWMGMLWLAAGMADPARKDLMWFYTLAGIVFIVLGFVVINYAVEMIGSVMYTVGFTLILYSLFGLYINLGKQKDTY